MPKLGKRGCGKHDADGGNFPQVRFLPGASHGV
jgi:hypothetical protein